MEEILTKFWQPIGSLIATIGALLVWGLRLEGKVKANAKDIARETEARKELAALQEKHRGEVREESARLEDRIARRLDDMGSDIKEMLQRTAHLGGK